MFLFELSDRARASPTDGVVSATHEENPHGGTPRVPIIFRLRGQFTNNPSPACMRVGLAVRVLSSTMCDP